MLYRTCLAFAAVAVLAGCDEAASPFQPEPLSESAAARSTSAADCYWRCAWSLVPKVGDFYPTAMNEDAHIAGQRGERAYVWNRVKGSWTALQSYENAHDVPRGMNNWGQVVGMTSVAGSWRPIVWEPNGSYYVVPRPGAGWTWGVGEARAVSENSFVVGVIDNQAFRYRWDEGSRYLGSLGGKGSIATAVNESGQVTGLASTSSGMRHAFRWTQAGGMTDLGVLPGDLWSEGRAINEKGWVVGVSQDRAFLWTPERGMIDLLSGRSDIRNARICEATGINDSGEVVGFCAGSDEMEVRGVKRRGEVPWFWRENTGVIALDMPADVRMSGVIGVNNWGDIIVPVVATTATGSTMRSAALLTWKGNEGRYGF